MSISINKTDCELELKFENYKIECKIKYLKNTWAHRLPLDVETVVLKTCDVFLQIICHRIFVTAFVFVVYISIWYDPINRRYNPSKQTFLLVGSFCFSINGWLTVSHWTSKHIWVSSFNDLQILFSFTLLFTETENYFWWWVLSLLPSTMAPSLLTTSGTVTLFYFPVSPLGTCLNWH